MADNPVSWFFLMVIGIYFICRFLKQIIDENECIKAEREEKACQEIFFENSIDKSNVAAYNKYQKNFGQKKF